MKTEKPPRPPGSAARPSSKSGTRGRSARADAGPPEPDPNSDLGLVLESLRLALDKKAADPVLLDVRALCSYCNYQLILSGRSERQVDAIADAVAAGLREYGRRPLGTEGARTGQWALLDFGDFVVHVFGHSVREHYDLEGLWNDAPRVPIEVPADAHIAADDYT